MGFWGKLVERIWWGWMGRGWQISGDEPFQFGVV